MIFSELSKDDKDKILNSAKLLKIKKDQILFKEGSLGESAFLIKKGEIEITKKSIGGEILLAIVKEDEVIGEMALLTDSPRSATAKALKDSTLFAIDKDSFNKLLEQNPSIAKQILKTVLIRWRDTEGLLRQSEKMAQLGVLTAGLAHELNNPAAALISAAGRLNDLINNHQDLSLELFKDLNYKQKLLLLELKNQVLKYIYNPLILDSLKRLEKEEEITKLLIQEKLSDELELSPILLNLNFSKNDLEKIKKSFNNVQTSLVLRYLSTSYQLFILVRHIGSGSSKISSLVGALKSYSYLDQGPVQEINILKGLEESLLILSHKIKKGIQIIKNYDDNIPSLMGYGSELNQVWTNIIDNALDVLGEIGKLTLRVYQDKKWVYVEIEDNGPGIPEEIQGKIFDPFFTTKPIGQGTGLGLDISYNIVVFKHKGEISFTSKPGKTIFTIKLPIKE